MRLLLGRILSWLITAGGWILVGVRTVLDLIGYSTLPEDAKVAAARIDLFFSWLVGVPWWAVFGFALVATIWLMKVSWPSATEATAQAPALGDRTNSGKMPPAPPARPLVMRPGDLKLISFVDEIFPAVHDLAEVHVDAMGNLSGNWRDSFLEGKAPEYLRTMNDEVALVVREFEPLRKQLQRHKFYASIFEFDDKIAVKINAVAEALRSVRSKAEALSFKFDKLSLSLTEPDIVELHRSIGQLRLMVGREFLGYLNAIRQAEVQRTT